MARRNKLSPTTILNAAMGANASSSATRLVKSRNSKGQITYGRNGSSTRGRMAAPGESRAGGTTQTLGNGRGGAQATRRQRYYDVRVGLGLAGG